jgi:hypothetical protein
MAPFVARIGSTLVAIIGTQLADEHHVLALTGNTDVIRAFVIVALTGGLGLNG